MSSFAGTFNSSPVSSDMCSERLAAALRDGDLNAFQSISPYAACLVPLLQELGWKDFSREVIEALPHFSEDLNLVDLRNILISLGYESEVHEMRLDKIPDELFPCIFIRSESDIRVLLRRNEDGVEFYDATNNQTRVEKPKAIKGTAYLLTDTKPTHGLSTSESSRQAWFTQLLQRFRGLILHLLAMTFLINFVALSVPIFIMIVYDKVIGAKSMDALPYLLAGVGILIFADLVMRFLRARILGVIAGRLDYLIGTETFKQLIYLPPLYTERSTVTAQLSRLKQFDSVRDFFTGQNAAIALELPFVVMFLMVMGAIAGPIALIPMCAIVGYVVFGLLWLPHLAVKVQSSAKANNDKHRMLMQTVAGRREIKAIGGETVWWERFREFSGEAILANYQTYIANGILNTIAQALTSIAALMTIAFGTFGVVNGNLTIGALIATMALLWRILSPLQGVFLSFFKFQQMARAIRQINQLMTLKVERDNSESGLMMAGVQGTISLDRVSFRHGPDQDPVLMGLSFNVAPGETLAILGDAGAGKSTILKLIAGMYRPQGGSLAIDGIDIRQVNAMDLRRGIAYVPQELQMFHGTIAQNLRLNNMLASDQELMQAARHAGILDNILALEKGFETRIGDSTTEHLPPGFLRGLSLARALANPVQIVLLDEPGASLDEEGDAMIMETIRRMRGERTVIMVSHRPSHIRLADKAVILDKGMVVFAGDPNEAVALMLERAK